MLKKYKYYTMIFASALIGFTSCSEQDEIGATLNVAPNVSAQSPGNIKIGTADAVLAVAASDGTTTPLASGTLTLLDANNNILAEVSQSLAGTADTVKMDNSISGLSARAEGTYKIVGSATDTGGLTSLTADTVTFELFDLPFDANYASMYILGGFNGWGGSAEDRADFAFELTGPNTWTLANVTLDGGAWKLSVGPNFDEGGTIENEDWADVNCTNSTSADGIMESKSGGLNPDNKNTDCGYSGTFTITFNDETFGYTMVNNNPPSAELSSLHLLGSFNGFFGDSTVAFTLDSSNYWVLNEVALAPGDVFRFFENEDGSGMTWGDNDADGTAAAGEGNIMLSMSMEEGFYKVEFNDLTLEYVLTYVRPIFPEELYLVGASSQAGWTPATSLPFMEVNTGEYRIFAYLEVLAGDDNGFKFLVNQENFDGNIGMGASAGMLQENGSNFTVDTDGFYRIDVNFNDDTYTITESNWAVTGAATPNGWPPNPENGFMDNDMTLVSASTDNYSFSVDLDLTADEMKFRENDSWSLNLGDNGADGTLEYEGANLVVTEAGNYTITLILDPDGYTYTLVKN